MKFLLRCCPCVACCGLAFSQQPNIDTLGMHNLTPGSGASVYQTSGVSAAPSVILRIADWVESVRCGTSNIPRRL